MTAADRTVAGDAPLGIICGAGTIPFAVAQAAVRGGRPVMLFGLRGFADAKAIAAHPHHWIAIGQFGRFCRIARAAGCRDLVLVGALVRPAVAELRLDWGTVRQLPHILRAFRGGDDHLLAGVARMFESVGFRVVAADEVAPDITVPPGVLGKHQPTPEITADIDRGLALLAATSPFDVGQAVVVDASRVLAIEAAEGTDNMLERIAALREAGRIRLGRGGGVLVKAPKRHQDRRFDLPSIGPDTVARAARAGLAGIAVVAGATIAAEPQRLIEAADHAGLFVIGCAEPEAWR